MKYIVVELSPRKHALCKRVTGSTGKYIALAESRVAIHLSAIADALNKLEQ